MPALNRPSPITPTTGHHSRHALLPSGNPSKNRYGITPSTSFIRSPTLCLTEPSLRRVPLCRLRRPVRHWALPLRHPPTPRQANTRSRRHPIRLQITQLLIRRARKAIPSRPNLPPPTSSLRPRRHIHPLGAIPHLPRAGPIPDDKRNSRRDGGVRHATLRGVTPDSHRLAAHPVHPGIASLRAAALAGAAAHGTAVDVARWHGWGGGVRGGD